MALLGPARATAGDQRETFGAGAAPVINVEGPEGGANLIGVDDSTGGATASIPFELIRARGEVQPQLALQYQFGADGDAGRNWVLAMPKIERKPLSGLPQYSNDSNPALTDRMAFNGAPLVPICVITGGLCSATSDEMFSSTFENWRYYRLLVDRTFQRFFLSPDLRTWRVEDPSGSIAEFGVPLKEPTYDAATDAETGPCGATPCAPFRWNLVRQWDTHGEALNPIVYRWQKFFVQVSLGGGFVQSRGYLTDIFDTPPAGLDVVTTDFTGWAHHVRLDYELQPFAVSSGGNALFRWHDYRLTRVSVNSMNFKASPLIRSEVRMYALAYSDSSNSTVGGRARFNSSYLSTVTPFAQAPMGTCSEDSKFSLPPSCPARALPATTLTYDGINDDINAGACEKNQFVNIDAAPIANESLPELTTAVDGMMDGLASFYAPADDTTQNPSAFVNLVPGTGSLTSATSSVVAPVFTPPNIKIASTQLLAPTTFDVLGDWGYDGASVLLGVGTADDTQGAVTAASSYMLLKSVPATGTFTWKEIVQVGYSAGAVGCRSSSDCTLTTGPVCLGGGVRTCGCNSSADCKGAPSGAVCNTKTQQCGCSSAADCGTFQACINNMCQLPTGSIFGDINSDGLIDEVAVGTPTTGGTYISTRDAGRGRVLPFSVLLPESENSTSAEGIVRALIDMDGDGLPDLVNSGTSTCKDLGHKQVFCGDFTYRAGDGRGCFGGCGIAPTYRTPDGIIVDGMSGKPHARLHDVNGDGIADVVIWDDKAVAVAFGVDGTHWLNSPPATVASGLGGGGADTRFGDINGDGVDDVLLTGGSKQTTYVNTYNCGRLLTVTNGYGAKAAVHYEPLAAQEQSGRSHGTAPISLEVVTAIDVTVPGGTPDHWSKSYFYDDPVYDSWHHELRGFKTVRERTGIEETFAQVLSGGVAKHHTQRITSYFFDGCSAATADYTTEMGGMPNTCNPDSDAGRQRDALPITIDLLGDSSTSADKSNPFPYVGPPTTTYRATTVLLYTNSPYLFGLDGRLVQHVFRNEVHTYLYDNAPFTPSPKTVNVNVMCNAQATKGKTCESVPITLHSSNYERLDRLTDYDLFGNLVTDTDLGHVNDAGIPVDPLDPPIVQSFVSQLVPSSDWTWRRVQVTVKGRGTIGHVTDYDRTFGYSWDSAGNLRQITGDLTGTVALDRFHENPLAKFAPNPANQSVDGKGLVLETLTPDPYGNVTLRQGPNTRCTAYAYDGPYAQLPTATTVYTTAGAGCSGDTLVSNVAYAREFATPTAFFSSTGAIATASLDDMGRPQQITQPSATTLGMPSPFALTIDWHNDKSQGAYHFVHVTGGSRESYIYLDAAGQRAFTVNRADPSAGDAAAWILNGKRAYLANQDILSYQALWFTGAPDAITTPSDPSTISSTSARTSVDEYFRPTVSYALDGTAVESFAYHALGIDRRSEASNFSSVTRNGHGRVASTLETVGGDNIQLAYRYTSAGQPAEIDRTHTGVATDVVSRWLQYDSFGRLVANLEPNTTDSTGMHYWRYAYDDAGEVVGTSDARGCGENLVYDQAGRLTSEDYSPCLNSQQAYSSPVGVDGTEGYYLYDASGHLNSAADRGAIDAWAYDFRDRPTTLRRAVARPGATSFDISTRYVHHVNEIDTSYDEGNRVVTISTGADVSDLLGAGSSSTITLHYSQRGAVTSVTSDYDGMTGPLLGSLTYEVDGLPNHRQYSDQAGTAADIKYDGRRRLMESSLTRASGWATPTGGYTPPTTSPPTTLQTTLEDTIYGYDADGNLASFSDQRLAAEWLPGSKPVNRITAYDEARRLTFMGYGYPGPTDSQTPVFTSAETTALPAQSLGNRVNQQSYTYDWLDNMTQSTDDLNAFFDRSLGAASHGSSTQGPHQLTNASGPDGQLKAQYDPSGNLVNLVVQREGACLGPVAKCVQRFVYDWDEIGQLMRARRWDYTQLPATDPPYPAVPTDAPAIDLSFIYHQNQRIIKDAANASGGDTFTVNIFESLRLDNATYDPTSIDYQRDSTTESVYLAGIARVVYQAGLPTRSGSGQHVLYQAGDQVGSTSTVFDRDTGEVVERIAYQGYGATDSDYRPDRWANYREPKRLSGNDDDIEVGLVYFGARYYSPNLQQWLSADPMTVHGVSSSFNPYSYVGASPLQRFDALGLQEGGTDPTDGSSPGTVLLFGGGQQQPGQPILTATGGIPGQSANGYANERNGVVNRHPVVPPPPPAPVAVALGVPPQLISFLRNVGVGGATFGIRQDVASARQVLDFSLGLVGFLNATDSIFSLVRAVAPSSVDRALARVQQFVDNADTPLPSASNAEKIIYKIANGERFITFSVVPAVLGGGGAASAGVRETIAGALTESVEGTALTTASGGPAVSTVLATRELNIGAHAAEQMAERGITKDMVQVALDEGEQFIDPRNGTVNYVLKGGFASGKDLLVGTNPLTGKITTAIRGWDLVRPRFVPVTPPAGPPILLGP